MTGTSVVLIADPSQQHLVEMLCRRFNIVGIVNPTRGRLTHPELSVTHSLSELTEYSSPDVCCAITPYRSMAEDVLLCLHRQIHVASTGPIPCSRRVFRRLCQVADEQRIHFRIGGLHKLSPRNLILQAKSRHSEFGQPVYLRLVSDGGRAFLTAWWSACDTIEQAEALLDSSACKTHLTAIRVGHCYHITLTLAMHNHSNAQLTIAPVLLGGERDLTLLGSGGLLTYDSLSNATGVITRHGFQPHVRSDQIPENAWLTDFIKTIEHQEPHLTDHTVFDRHLQLKQAIQEACREHRPVRVEV